MSDQVRAIAFVASAVFTLLSGLLLLGESAFTRSSDRPSRWSGVSLCALGAAFVALTVGDWPSLVSMWAVATQ